MFDIEYKGGNTVVIATKKATMICDPKMSVVGLKDLSTKDAIELATEARFAVQGSESVLDIESPGDFEVADFSIKGIAARRHIDEVAAGAKSTIYRIEIGDVSIGLLGNIAPELSEDEFEALGLVDILIIPVGGGGYTLDATSASSVIRQISPKVVIPVHYAANDLRYEVPQDSLENFTTELGAPVETVPKYKLKASSALPPTLTVIELTRD